ncbi:pentapeptide repeat-containing protein [Micromonospora chersina]|uniref:pentapeptide repeat-containing protein n=1 Tax=Micromonospora chersina TaxID=47854 RepID=UPI003D914BD6
MAERRTVRAWLWALGALTAALLLAFALVVGPWLLTQHPQTGLTAEQALKAKNDVRTTLVQALAGLAVAGGAMVTYRTFRQNQVEQDRSYALRQAEQVNALYIKAVEQLGHSQAPVRLGALYSLVHLGQANPQQRQTVVDVLCAYLRMPFPLPDSDTRGIEQEYAQQLQVRLAAQRLLADHLRLPEGASSEGVQELLPSPNEPFWPGMSLDLAGATLIGFDLHRASVIRATFDRATFTGRTYFGSTTFNGGASFRKACFLDVAWFDEATLAGGADFGDATFTLEVEFVDAKFTRGASFEKTTFKHDARFVFSTFGDPATFYGASFIGGAWFDEANFWGIAWFKKATFSGGVSFGGTKAADIDLREARVLPFDDEYLSNGRDLMRFWPPDWAVQADADDSRYGTLVREEHAETAVPAVPSAEPTSD